MNIFLPDHQCGDVAERTEGAAGVGCDHDIDTGEHNKFLVAAADGEHDRPHQQCRSQIIGDRRDNKGQQAGHPEQRAIAQTTADQPGAQRFEDIALLHRIDIGHRHQQKQHQFRVFLQIMAQRNFDQMRNVMRLVVPGNQPPDNACRQHHGLGFAQMSEFLGHHYQVGGEEQQH